MKKYNAGGLPPRALKVLGLTLPQWVLQRADEGIK